jgi:hypothetical protein
MDFEEKYQDVLQNMEFAIVQVYRRHGELTDHDVETVLSDLIRGYQAEQRQREMTPPTLNDLRQELYDGVKLMCDWRLGRTELDSPGAQGDVPRLAPLKVDEIVACLKRIRKSVQKWTKRGGRQGYLKFVEQFIV